MSVLLFILIFRNYIVKDVLFRFLVFIIIVCILIS